MNSDERGFRNVEWGPGVLFVVGGLLFLAGSARFILRHRFSFIDALYCCLAVVPIGLLLLVFSYVVQHAKLASVVPLFVGGFLVFSSPVADIALGLALMGAVADTALRDRKTKTVADDEV